jgi:hypothetical protein
MVINGVKVLSATMHEQRAVLGERVTEWLAANPTFQIKEIVVKQSSDSGFHCLSFSIFYVDPKLALRKVG